jgi:hypothetical protein
MTTPIDRTPDPKGSSEKPDEVSKHKKKPSADLEKVSLAGEATTEQQGGLIDTGPFKGLPLPLQRKGYRSSLPYISCNEQEQAATLTKLASDPSSIPRKLKVHLGFSVWFNLDLIAVTKPSYGILCDYDDKIMDIYQGIIESLAKSTNRREFVRHFGLFLEQNCENLFALTKEELSNFFNIQNELTRPGSWLASQDSFQVIKDLSTEGRLLFLNLDITDTQGIFPSIRDWLDKNNLELDTLYGSNIIDWLKDDQKQLQYRLNLKTISTENTRFIQAYAHVPKKSKKPQPKQAPIQYLVVGAENIKLPPL